MREDEPVTDHWGELYLSTDDMNVYRDPEGGPPLVCEACGGRVAGFPFVADEATAYHREHAPGYVAPLVASGWLQRLLRVTRRTS